MGAFIQKLLRKRLDGWVGWVSAFGSGNDPDPPSMGRWKSRALWVHTGLRPMMLARQWREGRWLGRKIHKKV